MLLAARLAGRVVAQNDLVLDPAKAVEAVEPVEVDAADWLRVLLLDNVRVEAAALGLLLNRCRGGEQVVVRRRGRSRRGLQLLLGRLRLSVLLLLRGNYQRHYGQGPVEGAEGEVVGLQVDELAAGAAARTRLPVLGRRRGLLLLLARGQLVHAGRRRGRAYRGPILEHCLVLRQQVRVKLNITLENGNHVAERQLEQELASFVAEVPVDQVGHLDPARNALETGTDME